MPGRGSAAGCDSETRAGVGLQRLPRPSRPTLIHLPASPRRPAGKEAGVRPGRGLRAPSRRGLKPVLLESGRRGAFWVSLGGAPGSRAGLCEPRERARAGAAMSARTEGAGRVIRAPVTGNVIHDLLGGKKQEVRSRGGVLSEVMLQEAPFMVLMPPLLADR